VTCRNSRHRSNDWSLASFHRTLTEGSLIYRGRLRFTMF
jgi:hypothetical protein